ncbi:DNA (cytosine-5-)-methyltransferase [Candidatus Pacearchaeota archaeon]|nr:DNA (cytosine-5-)-methyltransferase [Candidatus Pacearchaeota archaeon]
MEFIDLFSGLGGFNFALDDLGHKCVFACEIEDHLRNCYLENFGIKPRGDIGKIDEKEIPKHDILCAGFPCQPFSKAGPQKGLNDKNNGGLFYEIIRIIKFHQPTFLIMENVPNIKSHDDGKTWTKIKKLLSTEGYDVSTKDLSPHHFGIPQIRLRTYIVAKKGKLNDFKWPNPLEDDKPNISVLSILDENPRDARSLSPNVRKCLDVWQEFLDIVPEETKIPHPLWAMEFGATYPYEDTTPHKMTLKELRKYRGSFGKKLEGNRRKKLYGGLPSHARRPDTKFPNWKIAMIKRNRDFYKEKKEILDTWLPKIMEFPSSFQKLEWNVGKAERNINKYIIQCRASGVRVKLPTTSPSLVATNTTQIPIIAWENRYMTLLECSRLQSMEKLDMPKHSSLAYNALGNAVNTEVVKIIAESLLDGGVVKYGSGKTNDRYSTTS